MITDINWYHLVTAKIINLPGLSVFDAYALISVLVYFQMRRKHVTFAACGLFSLAVIMFFMDVLGTAAVPKVQWMHHIYTGAMSSQEIDETKHAEINPDFNHLHHRTASVVDYHHSFAESVKPTDMEKELDITKHGKTEDLGNRVNSTNRVRVIINAKYRTGSSFTGELFIKHSLFAYYFEPLHYFADITTTESRSEDVILWTLERLLNCTITDTDLEAGRLGTEFWKPIVLCGFKTGKHWKRNMHPAWKSNYIGSKVWYETTYSFLNFNGCTIEVWEWISNFIPHFMMRVINIRAEM